MKSVYRLWRLCVVFAAVIAIMAVPTFGNFNISLNLPHLTVRFAPSPGTFPDYVSGVRTGIFGFRIDELPEPIPPEGYTFVGWFSDGAQVHAPVAVVRSTTILANYSPIIDSDAPPSFAVVFNPGPGRLPEGTRPILSITYGETLTSLPIPVQEGYYFAGWQWNTSRITVPHIVQRDMELEAIWYDTPIQQPVGPVSIPENQFTAVFNPFPGTFSGSESGIRFGRFASNIEDLPQEPVRQGYIFRGWLMPNGESLESPFTMRGDITLTAVWEDASLAGAGAANPSTDTRPNPPTNPITISFMIFGAIGMLAAASAGMYVLNAKQAAAKGRYSAYITRCVREMKIVIKNRRK
ncbi:MAG: InlB B-repeat-containing protein [Defluviitaleaceae bacterium]|nr:InlB B-repeat-containing protein [Defluviitaleaceae bacterium]